MLQRLSLPFAALMLALAAPASAQLYKWVDRDGITNYSSAPPAEIGNAARVHSMPNRISTYSPDPALARALEALREGAAEPTPGALSPEEAGSRAQSRAAVAAAQAAQVAYEKCLESRQVDCERSIGESEAGPPLGIFVRHFVHPASASLPGFASQAFPGIGLHGAASYATRIAPSAQMARGGFSIR